METKSKYLILSLGLTLITLITVQAQPHGGGKGKAHRGPDSCHIQLMVDDMRQELDLSEKQVKQIEEIHYVHMEEARALKNEYQNDCVGEREARLSLRNKMDKEVRAVLSKGQLEEYDEFMKERRGPHGHGYKKK